MFDTVKRLILNQFPLPKAQGTENKQLAFCHNMQTALTRCRSRIDSISVLFSNNKYEECLLLINDVLPRLLELHGTLAGALAEKSGDRTVPLGTNRELMSQLTAYAAQPIDAFSDEHIKTVSFLTGSLRKLYSDTTKLYWEYREQQPLFSEHYAYVGKKVLPFLTIALLVGLFVSGLYASKLFASFKDLDIRFNWLTHDVHPRVVIEGIELAERDGSNNKLFAWGLGPHTTVAFNCPDGFEFELDLLAVPCLKDQYIDVFINGNNVQHITNPTGDCSAKAQPEKILFKSRKGVNTIDIVYSDWNMKNTQYLTGEPRPLSARFYTFSLKRTYRP